MEASPERFAAGARRALADAQLQRALAAGTDRLRDGRALAFAALPEGEGDRLRDRARAIKARALCELDRLLAELAERIEARGGVVHWAADAAEAREIAVRVALAGGRRRVVKSKSMTSEEIGLNAALEAAGAQVVETDLGEYVVQIAGEAPSHIITPAIHKTKDEIAALFAARHGTPRKDAHEELTREARERLRRHFLEAEVGITGVNFAVARTGTLAIVENEGNVRLATSLPRRHVAIMGMEKVVPDLEALGVFLRLLARSATGQAMSSYVSLLTGPRRPGEEDGPDELHLVVLDNGRSRLLADPRLRESLHCIRCGACLNVCPVYRHAGGHAYGFAYPGPIGAILNPTLAGPAAAALPFASTLCGACADVCPVRIPIPQLLLRQRERVVAEAGARPEGAGGGRLEAALARAYAWVMASPGRYRLAARLGRAASRPFARRGWMRRAPGLGAWTRSRDFPAPAARSFLEDWRSRGD